MGALLICPKSCFCCWSRVSTNRTWSWSGYYNHIKLAEKWKHRHHGCDWDVFQPWWSCRKRWSRDGLVDEKFHIDPAQIYLQRLAAFTAGLADQLWNPHERNRCRCLRSALLSGSLKTAGAVEAQVDGAILPSTSLNHGACCLVCNFSQLPDHWWHFVARDSLPGLCWDSSNFLASCSWCNLSCSCCFWRHPRCRANNHDEQVGEMVAENLAPAGLLCQDNCAEEPASPPWNVRPQSSPGWWPGLCWGYIFTWPISSFWWMQYLSSVWLSQVKSYEEVMSELQRRVEEGSQGKAPSSLSNYGKSITTEYYNDNPRFTWLNPF